MSLPERSPERDSAIETMLPLVADHGWSLATLRRALSDHGADPLDAEMLFPGGTTDLIETYCDLTDRQMEADAAQANLSELGLSRRVHAVVALRLRHQRAHRDAIRRAVAVLVAHPRLAALITARTVDSIWFAAGDRTADFTWYTKRAILGSIYSATLLFWLRDTSDDDEDTLAFLDRRLAEHGRVHKAVGRLNAMFRRRPKEKAAEAA